jgi:hypothetical protein
VKNIAVKQFRANILGDVLAMLQRQVMDIMLIKGIALDHLVYEQPWYTMSDDVDVVIRRKGTCNLEGEVAAIRACLRQRAQGIPTFELRYFDHCDVTMSRTLPVDFQTIWDDAAIVTCAGHDVYAMSPEDMLIPLCINSCRKRFYRLKALCDIAETIRAFPAIKWEQFVSKSRQYDCHPIVYTALLITQATLGCQVPEQMLDDLAVGPLRSAIIRFLGQRLSFSSLSSLYTAGWQMGGRDVGLSLLLPCATQRWYQRWRYLRVIAGRMRQDTRQGETHRRAWQLPFPR